MERVLLNRSEEWFADWLQLGLLSYEFGSDVSGQDRPFAEIQPLIDTRGQLLEQLSGIYAQFTERDKLSFNRGLAQIARRLDLDTAQDEILALRVVALSTAIGARDPMFILAYRLDLRRTDPFAVALIQAAVEGMASQPSALDENAKDVLQRLVRHSSFGELQARRALPALCAAAPTALLEHLRILHEHLQSRYAPSLCEDPESARYLERRKRVTEALDLVSDEQVIRWSFEHWRNRTTIGETPGHRAQSQDWWLASLQDPVILARARQLKRVERPTSEPVAAWPPPGVDDPGGSVSNDEIDDIDVAHALALIGDDEHA